MEVLIVVVVLGILAAIVVPQFGDASQASVAATLRTTLGSVRARIDYQYHRAHPPAYPPVVDSSWFAGGAGLNHPENSYGIPAVEVDATPNRLHPPKKVLNGSVGGAFWYNPTNGKFRARVAFKGNNASTLSFYNLVNDANETDLGNGGGGGGAS